MELTDSAAPAAPAPETDKPAADAPSPDAPKPEEKAEVPAESPKDETTPETPEAPKEELFDLPDGRKVNAAGLKAEYENLLPEFTRKSQELARLKGEGDPKDIKKPEDDVPEWKKPDYEPKSYAEVIEIAKKEALADIQKGREAEQQHVKAIQSAVDTQLGEIRALDPKLDEKALFLHATKYGFHDLKAAHANMTDMRKVAVDTEQRVVKNLKGREADPVSGGAGGTPAADDGYDPSETGQYGSASEFLAKVKGK